MTLAKVKLFLYKVDGRLFNGQIKAFHSRFFKYRGKAYRLTQDLYFPPHTSSNKNIRLGQTGELLAIGGDLTPDRMVHAYKNGVFPMFFDDQPILWWTSEIRCVIFPEDIHIPKDVQKFIKSKNFHLTVDKSFHDVISACSESRKDYTWLTRERMVSLIELHKLGIAHSVEVCQDEKLVGGLFFVAIGSCYMGESMFARVNHASKVAFIALSLRLREMNYIIQDCGFLPTDHLKKMGAVVITRDEFLKILDQGVQIPDSVEAWGDLFKSWDFSQAVKSFVSQKQGRKGVGDE